MALTPFDYAVIDYAQSRGEPSEKVYARIDSKCGSYYRGFFSEQQLLSLLEAVKADDAAFPARKS